ncbi:MAG: hypothetical protein U5J96_16725 [Ignavibacteriaceae bacterium]|nr:hypothetical protein [Ignavibacteriaceae bacterium]
MNFGIIIYSSDAETVWNAFRLGVFSLKEGDKVKTFLLAKGVECERLVELTTKLSFK